MLNKLLQNLDVLSDFDRETYDSLEYETIEKVSRIGSSCGAALIDGNWLPKSQLRCDRRGNLYIAKWLKTKRG